MDLQQDAAKNDVRERIGTIVGSTGAIPMALWTPPDEVPGTLILVGHGGSGNKKEEYVVALARRLVRTYGMAVCAIDGPVHGDRRASGDAGAALQSLEFGQVWANDSGMTDAMVNDWRNTLDDLLREEVVSSSVRIGYWGLSMGTILGLPYVAADDRIEAAVLGLMGIVGPTKSRIAHDAATITIPLLFLMQWDDELFKREYAFELFDALGSSDKTLIASPGSHTAVTKETFIRTADFLADRLGSTQKVAK